MKLLLFAVPMLSVAALLLPAVPAAAHPHTISVSGQVIAHGQNHPAFDAGGLACESNGPAGGVIPIGPAWFGLETAHHGPDEATPGKADGCYQLTGTTPGADQPNPVIR